MRKNVAHLFISITFFTLFLLTASPSASGQGQFVPVIPTRLYRFQVSATDGGFLLTGYYLEGTDNDYEWDPGAIHIPGDGFVGIYFPPAGYLPDPSSGLVPLHRWTVIQNGWRTHYYYSTYYTEQPADRYYNGIAGYVFPPGQTQYQGIPLHQLSVFYSADYGFWNGYGAYELGGFVEAPPQTPPNKSPFIYQGVIAALPQSIWDNQFPPPFGSPPFGSPWQVVFHAPTSGGGGGGGEGSCNPPQSSVNACQHNGGWWDYDLCYCQY